MGLDLGDGSHAVALGMRLAQGDLPLADEMNLQSLGSLPAVPFIWLWLQVVGTDGIILAARLTFVLLAALTGWVCWRALRPLIGSAVAGAAVAAALIPAPYNLTVVSYNTSAGLLLLVAACAGARAVDGTNSRWAATSGVTAVLAALCYPVTAPAAVLTVVMVVLLSRRRQVVLGLGLAVLAVGAAVSAWLVGVVGLEHLRETVDFTTAYQAQRISPSTRLGNAWRFYAATMTSPAVLGAATLGGLAAVPRIPRTLRALLVGVVPLVLATVAVREIPVDSETTVPLTGLTSGVLGLVMVLVLLPPAAVWAIQAFRASQVRSRGLAALLLIAVVPAAVQVPLICTVTSSSPQWGAAAAAMAPALCAVLAATGSLAREASARTWALAALTSTAVLLATHTIQPFRDPAPWHLTKRDSSGAAAGILTSAEGQREVHQVARAVASCQKPGESLLAYGVPAAFAFGDGPMDTNILWLGAFGSANEAGVRWIERTGREPTCVVVSKAYLLLAGPSVTARTASDPLLRWLAPPRYRVVDQPVEHLLVWRRVGS